MKRSLVAGFALALSTLVSAPALSQDGAVDYAVDASSSFIVQTWKDGAAARLAHDHAIAATKFKGTVAVDPDDKASLVVDVEVDAASLVVDGDDARRAVGLEGSVPEQDRAAVTETMRGEEVLDVAKHKTIRFTSTKAEPQSDGSVVVTGRLTLHGVTRTVRLPVQIEKADAGVVVGSGTLRLKVSDYGITPYSAFFGAVKVKDEVKLHLRIVGRPRA